MNPIISLTSIPQRLPYIKPCIESLKKQNLPIRIYLPIKLKRTGKTITVSDIPYFLPNKSVKFVHDQGSITKLRPALAEGYKTIITADDDIEYPQDWASNMMYWSEQYPNCAIAHRGRNLDPKKRAYRGYKNVVENPAEPTEVNLVTGVRGVLYKRSFFSEEFINSTEHTTVDDIDISVELLKNNIPILVVPKNNSEKITDAYRIDGLAKANGRGGKNDEMLEKKGFWALCK